MSIVTSTGSCRCIIARISYRYKLLLDHRASPFICGMLALGILGVHTEHMMPQMKWPQLTAWPSHQMAIDYMAASIKSWGSGIPLDQEEITQKSVCTVRVAIAWKASYLLSTKNLACREIQAGQKVVYNHNAAHNQLLIVFENLRWQSAFLMLSHSMRTLTWHQC